MEIPQEKLAFGVETSNRRFRLRLARYRYHAEKLRALFPQRPLRILDAGCGSGRLPGYWRRWGSKEAGTQLVGLDISEYRLSLARGSGYDMLLRADLINPWPLEDASFDAVICEQVLEHLDAAQARFAISEIHRVLRPNGCALIGTPIFKPLTLRLSFLWMPIHRWIRRLGGRDESAHLQHYSLDSLGAHARSQGFRLEEARGFRVISFHNNWFEDSERYYRLQQWIGQRVPGLCGEVNILCRKVG